MKNNNIDILNLNLSSTKDLKQLTKEEEIYLCKLIEKGNSKNASLRDQIKAHDAKNKMIYSHIGMVVDIAKNYYSSIDMSELIQYGITGLEGAINTFDYRKAKFSTHANLWVMQAIKRGIENRERIIKIPPKVLAKIRLINKVTNQITTIKGREPTFNELKNELKGKIEGKEIRDLLVLSQSTKSLDNNVYENNKELDFVNDEFTIDPNEYKTKESNLDSFYKVFGSLPSLDRHIFTLKNGLDDHKERNFTEICHELCISVERVKKSLKNTELFLNKNKIIL